MKPETIAELERLNERWANGPPLKRAQDESEMLAAVMDHLPDLLAAVRERGALKDENLKLIASQQMCVGAAGIGDFSELCGWIDRIWDSVSSLEFVLKGTEQQRDALKHDCGNVQCKQVHRLLDAQLAGFGLMGGVTEASAFKALRLYDEIKNLRVERDQLQAASVALMDALGFYSPRSVIDVLNSLATWCEHLSDAHDCDCIGYEGRADGVKAARCMAEKIAHALCTDCGKDWLSPEKKKVLVSAIQETLDENSHLADGDTCTLLKLKQALADFAKDGI
jgi:hypothetical protein